MKLKRKIAHLLRCSLTLVSPRLNTDVLYAVKKRKLMNWKNPEDFTQKLLKLKITQYNHDERVKICADKYAVREYIQKCGLNDLLNELLAVYDDPRDIEWEKLPEQFVIKLSSGSGFNIICRSKSDLDKKATENRLMKWGRKNQWADYAELQYKDAPTKIIVEKFLSGKDGVLPEDYKVYCFHGQPAAILYITGRGSSEYNGGFFDLDWNYLGNTKKTYKGFTNANLPAPPASLKEMAEAARILSKGFPFVRVDFYDVAGKAIFGEMTFTPAGCFDTAEISINGKQMGELL